MDDNEFLGVDTTALASLTTTGSTTGAGETDCAVGTIAATSTEGVALVVVASLDFFGATVAFVSFTNRTDLPLLRSLWSMNASAELMHKY